MEGNCDVLDLRNGDSAEVLKEFGNNSIDAIVCDPPYGLAFMGKDWDKALPPKEVWQECLRVLKPGGYIVAMSGSRTYHRLAVDLEDIGFTTHPMIGWIYGSGFPKATDLSKQFDKQAGVKGDTVGSGKAGKGFNKVKGFGVSTTKPGEPTTEWDITAPATDLAKKWDGFKYGLQALKPALEPIYVGQKPIDGKRMTDNVVKHGVGAMNIEACRVPYQSQSDREALKRPMTENNSIGWKNTSKAMGYESEDGLPPVSGRHPANLLHDGSESVEAVFLEQGGVLKSGGKTAFRGDNASFPINNNATSRTHYKESGTASRFFNSLPYSEDDVPFLYQAKASKSERGEGNHHPTVKPQKLMAWLIKLVTPPGGTVLDPFMGSGSTGLAAKSNGFGFVGIERDPEYYRISWARLGAQGCKEEVLSQSSGQVEQSGECHVS